MKIAVYGKTIQPEDLIFLGELFQQFELYHAKAIVFEPFMQSLAGQAFTAGIDGVFSQPFGKESQINLLISIGGDGTLLDSIKYVGNSGIPVLGINMGRMGFLSSISKKELVTAIRQVFSGDYKLETRTLLRVISPPSLFGNLDFALNEFTVSKKDTSGMILVHVWVDDRFLHSYWADGLIVATPTGSTAYSLSCNGPIITPDSTNFVITPIATHNLTVRPVVIPDTSTIRIRVEGRSDQCLASMDSRAVPLAPDTEVVLRKAGFTINLMQLSGQYFFRTIREKLSWGKDIRN